MTASLIRLRKHLSLIPEKVLYLPELAVQAVVHIDVFHLFSLLPLFPLHVSLFLIEVGRVVQVELGYHIQARPKIDYNI